MSHTSFSYSLYCSCTHFCDGLLHLYFLIVLVYQFFTNLAIPSTKEAKKAVRIFGRSLQKARYFSARPHCALGQGSGWLSCGGSSLPKHCSRPRKHMKLIHCSPNQTICFIHSPSLPHNLSLVPIWNCIYTPHITLLHGDDQGWEFMAYLIWTPIHWNVLNVWGTTNLSRNSDILFPSKVVAAEEAAYCAFILNICIYFWSSFYSPDILKAQCEMLRGIYWHKILFKNNCRVSILIFPFW